MKFPALFALLLASPALADCPAPTAACPEIAALLAQREGYGRLATGGLDGQFAMVTSDADSGPGSLREAVERAAGPRWVRFARDMNIALKDDIRFPPNITVDGRGHAVTIEDHGFLIYNRSHNVILTHLTFDGRFADKKDANALIIAGQAHDIWADHLTMSHYIDRLVDVIEGATDVTLSWLRFESHNKVMVVNNRPEGGKDMFANYERDADVRVTLHHSYFLNTVQRNPRVVLGMVHLYNNLLEDWDYYGMSFSMEARGLVEGNVFANKTARACVEPDHFDTIEGVTRNYCDSIPYAPARAFLPNGDADKEDYAATDLKYHYTRELQGFVKLRDNLFLGDAKGTLTDYKPERVPAPPYCAASLEAASVALAQRIRLSAGNVAGAPAAAARSCPAAQAGAVASRPAAAKPPEALAWSNYSADTAEFAPYGNGGVALREKPGAKKYHAATTRFFGYGDRKWVVEVTYKPAGDRGVQIMLADENKQDDAMQGFCGQRGGQVLNGKPAHRQQISLAAAGDGYVTCRFEGVPNPEGGNRLRFDLSIHNGTSNYFDGDGESGIVVRDVSVKASE